jgi:subtilisin family serine protease
MRLAPRPFLAFCQSLAVALLCLHGSAAPAARPSVSPGPLQLGAPAQSAKTGSAVYIVQLKPAAAASYKGGTEGYAATKPVAGAKLNRGVGSVASYAQFLESNHDRLLADIGAGDRKIYSYKYAFNGFAAQLTAAELSRLARSGQVARVWLDSERQLQTNSSGVFLGLLNQNGGLRADLGLRGENVVIGVIDSGIAPTHPALRDYEEHIPRACRSDWATSSWLGLFLCHSVRRNPPTTQTFEPPLSFHGACQEGEGFTSQDCSNKVVGARYYIDGFLFRNDLDEHEFVSPRDADGHGTHVATIAAGNQVTAELFGTRIGDISGIAPRAQLAIYKACWLKPGEQRATCATSDLARAIDDAVADGVDIINYSIGSLETDLTAPDDFALLNALDAGVLSVVAAGNDGPAPGTIGSPSSAPWVLTVAASTQTGTRYEEAVEITAPSSLAGPLLMREASFTPQLIGRAAIEGSLVLVDDGESTLALGGLGSTADACESLQNAAQLDGEIALIERGGCNFDDKIERVQEAGAVAAVVYDTSGSPIVMNGDADRVNIPAVMIGAADAQRIVDSLAADNDVTIRLQKGELIEQRDTGNRMSSFSSRGPGLSEWDFLKPDVTAPGVNILAGNTPDVANGQSGELYRYFSGTSQAAPEVAGVAALLKQAHPLWSPGALKSALMTTAYQGVRKATSEAAADPFDMGAGHIDPNRAIEPGLVYDATFLDHAAYLCGYVEPPFPETDCNLLAQAGYPFAPRDLNLPSIGIGELITGDVVSRTVTNVGPPARYDLSVTPPAGVNVTVDPPSLSLGTGESAEFTVSFDVGDANLESWAFGRLSWSDGTRTALSPMAVRPVLLRAPEEISLGGSSGEGTLPVDFGYDGDFFAGVHGLHAPFFREPDGFVDDDASNNFSFRTDNGVTAHYMTVEPGDLFLRVALFDELTDGDDDLDLYLFYCITPDNCTQVGQGGGFTSDEQIDLLLPPPGLYAVLVHGFETDQVSGGPGANYELQAWAFADDDAAGNMGITWPTTVVDGDRLDLPFDWGPLAPGTRYLGAFALETPFDLRFLTIVTVDVP